MELARVDGQSLGGELVDDARVAEGGALRFPPRPPRLLLHNSSEAVLQQAAESDRDCGRGLRRQSLAWGHALRMAGPPDGSGALVTALDLHTHQAVAEHSDGRVKLVALTPDQPAADVTPELLEAVRELGGLVEMARRPRRCRGTCRWTRTTSTRAMTPNGWPPTSPPPLRRRLLAAFRAPYRGRSTPVNAWWGSFRPGRQSVLGAAGRAPSDDFIMRNAMDSLEVAIGWWPGDPRYGRAAFYAYAHPAPNGFADGKLTPPPRAERRSSASTCSTGTTSARPPIHTPSRSTSHTRRSSRPAWCAIGIPPSPPAPRASRRPSPEDRTLVDDPRADPQQRGPRHDHRLRVGGRYARGDGSPRAGRDLASLSSCDDRSGPG